MKKSRKCIYYKNNLKLKCSLHFIERLRERFGMEYYQLFPIINTFVYHNGTKYCNGSLTVNAKVYGCNYPNNDYLYSRKFDMIITFDRTNKTIITLENYATDDYYKHCPKTNTYKIK